MIKADWYTFAWPKLFKRCFMKKVFCTCVIPFQMYQGTGLTSIEGLQNFKGSQIHKWQFNSSCKCQNCNL